MRRKEGETVSKEVEAEGRRSAASQTGRGARLRAEASGRDWKRMIGGARVESEGNQRCRSVGRANRRKRVIGGGFVLESLGHETVSSRKFEFNREINRE